MNQVIFDASALLALLQQEQGYEIAEKYLSHAVMSTVNISEVVTVLSRKKVPFSVIKSSIETLIVRSIDFNIEQAYLVSNMVQATKKYGLAFGDRACLTLGEILQAPILTADKVWKKLKTKSEIILIR